MGPRLPAGQGAESPCGTREMAKRTIIIKFRVSETERAAIIEAGALLGSGPSTFARMAAVRAAGLTPAKAPRKKPDTYVAALALWTAQLGRIGSNVNQCAKILNYGGSAQATMWADIRAELQLLRDLILRFDQEPH
jgi:Bacterial mobilisation protein (MobC)